MTKRWVIRDTDFEDRSFEQIQPSTDNNLFFASFYRELNNLKKKKQVGYENLDGRAYNPYLDVFQLVGYHHLHNLYSNQKQISIIIQFDLFDCYVIIWWKITIVSQSFSKQFAKNCNSFRNVLRLEILFCFLLFFLKKRNKQK